MCFCYHFASVIVNPSFLILFYSFAVTLSLSLAAFISNSALLLILFYFSGSAFTSTYSTTENRMLIVEIWYHFKKKRYFIPFASVFCRYSLHFKCKCISVLLNFLRQVYYWFILFIFWQKWSIKNKWNGKLKRELEVFQ